MSKPGIYYVDGKLMLWDALIRHACLHAGYAAVDGLATTSGAAAALREAGQRVSAEPDESEEQAIGREGEKDWLLKVMSPDETPLFQRNAADDV